MAANSGKRKPVKDDSKKKHKYVDSKTSQDELPYAESEVSAPDIMEDFSDYICSYSKIDGLDSKQKFAVFMWLLLSAAFEADLPANTLDLEFNKFLDIYKNINLKDIL